VHRRRQHVVGDFQVAVLVEVVADAGSVAEQVFDRDRVVDQWQISAEQQAGRHVEREGTVLHECHRGQRGECLGATGHSKASVDGVGDRLPAVREAVGLGQLDFRAPVHP